LGFANWIGEHHVDFIDGGGSILLFHSGCPSFTSKIGHAISFFLRGKYDDSNGRPGTDHLYSALSLQLLHSRPWGNFSGVAIRQLQWEGPGA